MVTADGRILRAAEDQHPDLFWAHPRRRRQFRRGDRVRVRAARACRAHRARACTTRWPARTGCWAGRSGSCRGPRTGRTALDEFRPKGRAAALDAAERDRPPGAHVRHRVVRRAGGRAGNCSARSATSLGPVASELGVVPFADDADRGRRVLRPGPAVLREGHVRWRARPDLIDVVIAQGRRLGSEVSQIEVLSMGGAIRRVAPEATAFPHRDAAWLINIPASWRSPQTPHRRSMGQGHVRGPAAGLFRRRIRQLHGPRRAGRRPGRLRRARCAGCSRSRRSTTRSNVFRLNQNISPAARHDRVADGRAAQPGGPAAAAACGAATRTAGPGSPSRTTSRCSRPCWTHTGTGPGTRLLDLGCGSGLLLALAQARGATVTGLDVTPGLLRSPGTGCPTAELWQADIWSLPFGAAEFDVVTGVNAVQFAADPPAALRRGGPGLPARRPGRDRHVCRAGAGRIDRRAPGHGRAQPAARGRPSTRPTRVGPGNLAAALAAAGWSSRPRAKSSACGGTPAWPTRFAG